jgi:hypothetical protein
LIVVVMGVAAAVGAFVALPGFRAWVLRVTGRRSDREYYEDVAAEDAPLPEEDAGETDDLRLSLRARLAESGPAPEVEDVVAANAGAAEAADAPEATTTIDEARARVRAKARDAKRRLTETADDSSPKTDS